MAAIVRFKTVAINYLVNYSSSWWEIFVLLTKKKPQNNTFRFKFFLPLSLLSHSFFKHGYTWCTSWDGSISITVNQAAVLTEVIFMFADDEKWCLSRTAIHTTLWRQTHSLGTAVSFGKIHLSQGNHGISCSQKGCKIPPIPCGINSDLHSFRLAICLFTAS